MQSLVVSSNFKELTDDEMQEVNGGAKPLGILVVGAVSGALIGIVHAARNDECLLAGAGKGAIKGTVLAVSKVIAIGLPVFNTVSAGYWSFKAFKATNALLGN